MSDEANSGGGKMVSEDTVAVLLMAMGSVSITKAQFNIMSSLDGTRTASSFEHAFRPITKKAKELKARVDNGETFEAVAPAKKRSGAVEGATPPTTPKKPKGTPKATPKATPKSRGKKGKVAAEAPPTNDFEKGVEFDKDIDLDFGLKKEELEDELI
ncbi:uncharacterized protein N0V89_011498 [Didymosphaeria variabile]|uniref:Uncharacterized protein n=1 Tax=Didymosphaeria variabile TaxID=1932322 RepID=A0A9W8XAN4_9PLEO|nr:uncharacterized protein N0V89_011498 [Didymosphaeria variabile]KAJ4345368.1 hypothetical protein N0V89_011498 [Didymosphaeria variabile]